MARQARSTFLQDFIDRTRRARSEGGFTQEEMAELLGIGQGTYKNYEVKRMLPHTLVVPFCLATRVDIAWLYTGKVPQQRQRPATLVRRKA